MFGHKEEGTAWACFEGSVWAFITCSTVGLVYWVVDYLIETGMP